ncbi:MAG: NFACT family protein [Candidatus Aenigmarchaeota archaeon]|nr:NFACT family protein [Candidatus Aenigmarchaeota archaeon]
MEMTGLDMRQCLMEKPLKSARIENIYHKNNSISVRVYSHGKNYEIHAGLGYFFISDRHEQAESATQFAMVMRKYLRGYVIKDIYQLGLDRVFILETEKNKLILEVFRNGNIILTNESNKIISVMRSQRWKSRELIAGKNYKEPEYSDITKIIPDTDNVIEAVLFKSGCGLHCKAILKSAGVENKPCSELSKNEKEKIIAEINRAIRDDKAKNEIFESLYENEQKQKNPENDRILSHQVRELGKVREEKKNLEKIINTLNNNYSIVEEIIRQVIKSSWNKGNLDVVTRDFILSMNPKTKSIKISLENMEMGLNVNRKLSTQINDFYNLLKKYENKIDKIQDIMNKNEDKKFVKRRQAYKKQKFRRFTTSDGIEILMGKDAKSNEALIKKNLQADDIVFHADVQGGAFTVLKSDKPTKTALEEAAVLCACFSKAWPMGLGSVNVYWVKPEQLDKRAMGEYISTGAFVVHGKRNYMRAELKFALGINRKGEIISGPIKYVEKNSQSFVVLQPGEDRNIGKKIRQQLLKNSSDGMEEIINVIKPSEFFNFIPSRKASLA